MENNGVLGCPVTWEPYIWKTEAGAQMRVMASFCKADIYEFYEARKRLGPEHKWDSENERYSVRVYWKRIIR